MKKIISLLIATLMILSIFSFSVFAEEEEKSEFISFRQTDNNETEHFVLLAQNYGYSGWYGGDNSHKLTITAKNKDIVITRIETNVGYWGEYYGDVGVSSGTKRETGSVNNGDTVHIDNINSNTFSFNGGNDRVEFNGITVYYADSHTHSYGEDNKCTICSLPKCEIEGHNYGDSGKTCINCGLTKCEIEGHHSYQYGFCTLCGQKYVEKKSETISFKETCNKETENFVLTAQSYSENGWRGGNDNRKLTITAKNNDIVITHVEAVIGAYGSCYVKVGVSGGTKREIGSVNDGSTVHIDNINSNTFSFSGGNDYAQFKDITVYYEDAHNFTHTHNYDEDNVCTVCGLTKCEVEKHHSFGDDNTCVYCNITKCEAEGHHSYKHGFCTLCGQKYEEEPFETIGFVQSNNKDTDHFTLTDQHYDNDGWFVGNGFTLTITAKDSNIKITRIEADIGYYVKYYDEVNVSGGTKRETGSVNKGDTVHIDNINSNTFSFSGGKYNAQFKDITVFYEYTNGTGSTISEGNIWIIAGIGIIAIGTMAIVAKKKKKVTE